MENRSWRDCDSSWFNRSGNQCKCCDRKSKTSQVEWESLDDQPVSLIFLLAAPTGDLQKTHLQNLSQLASVVAHKAHVDALMKCETKEEFFELFETYFNEFTKRKEA